MKKAIIHINQHIIKSNIKNNEEKPCITVKSGRQNTYAKSVDITDKFGNIIAKVLYTPCKPLACGARAYIEVIDSANVRINNDELPVPVNKDTGIEL